MYDLYCHIWLNFPKDDHHYFYILLFTISILVTLNILIYMIIIIALHQPSPFHVCNACQECQLDGATWSLDQMNIFHKNREISILTMKKEQQG
jgi:hypothetical protein